MKTIKRCFGVLLVGVILLNLFAVASFAAVKEDRLISLRLKTLNTNVQAGDTITFIVNAESKPDFPMWNTGTWEVGFNTNYFSIGSYADSVTIAGYAYEGTLNEPLCKIQDYGTDPTGEEVALYNWNDCRQIMLVERYSDADWIDMSPEGGTDLIEFRMTVNSDTPDGEYYIGFSISGFDNMTAFMNEQVHNSAYHGFSSGLDYGLSDTETPLYDLSGTIVKITVGDAASTPVVTNDGVKVQWDSDASHVKLGYKATISDLALTTEVNTETGAVEITNLSEVGVIFSTTITNPTLADVGSGAAKATCNTLYDNKDGTYSFRAVVRNAAIDSTTTLNSVMYITLADGTTSYYSTSGATTPKAAFDAGRANGMPDFGA